MGFLGVYRAIYDYAPQADGELTIGDGDLLYILDKNDDDGWWKAKRKAGATDEDEPEGFVPNNYVEPATALSQARAIYEYTRQTDEELSFPEDALLDIFDTSDPDWILAGHDDEYGFVPSNYIEVQTETGLAHTSSYSGAPDLSKRSRSGDISSKTDHRLSPESPESPSTRSRIPPTLTSASPSFAQSGTGKHPSLDERQSISEDHEEDETLQSPSLPSRPQARTLSGQRPSDQLPALEPSSDNSQAVDSSRTPGGFHLYNINEMVTVMGKRKKMPTTLGVNLKTGTILIAPEHTHDDPSQEWTADKMTHYSREGKHVFLELVRPSRSVDFHAGAKDTAEEIVAALGELAGAIRAEGLREVIMAGSPKSQRQGQVLYDFMAQGDDEVTVAAGDEVIIIDDTKSEEWWQIRRQKNGKEGVLPSSYIQLTRNVTSSATAIGSISDSARSTIDANRLEEIRLTREAVKASKEPQQRGRREHGRPDTGTHPRSKSKPDSSKLKTWTDRTGSFSVEAQFLGLKDGKIQLHKMNGVKIAVPVAKMSRGDLEYVENVTGASLDDDKPLADVKRSSIFTENRPTEVGASVEKREKPEYDWFKFFLSCDVAIGLCERYAQAFIRDSMDESVLPDVNATILRTLGLREGDIIKVMRKLDTKFDRDPGKSDTEGENNISGGLFSGPGGTLRNNTRKSRTAPTVQHRDVADAVAIPSAGASVIEPGTFGRTSPAGTDLSTNLAGKGFEDNAWDVKPPPASQYQAFHEAKHGSSTTESRPRPVATPFAGSMEDLSQLSEPLEPSRMESQHTSTSQSSLGNNNIQPTVAFNSSTSTASNASHLRSSPQALIPPRPMPSSVSSNQGTLTPSNVQRPSSAPQSTPQAMFVPPRSVQPSPGSAQSQVAPPGQSLNDLRLQQQYAAQTQQHHPALTGYSMPHPSGIASFSTADPGQQQQLLQPGMPCLGPLADHGLTAQFSSIGTQPTGFRSVFPHSHLSSLGQNSNVNSFLPPPLQPQPTSLMRPANPSGFAQPLQPQKTGPPPPVRFGLPADSKKLAPQPTGRRANLAQASEFVLQSLKYSSDYETLTIASAPDNPFGF
ncbi:hypothetical protein CP533_6963 [Ophiocordyceps camponoti-saundersi (nom. inval.)]|nr:hypothetical protein CP533_6963 [Ophiocordyceps camponoti-saundersi (nom. inval.)]